MDKCSIKAAVVSKVKEEVQKSNTFTVDSSDIIKPSLSVPEKRAKSLMGDVNKSFGGKVIVLKRGIYTINPAKNVINAYLLETKKDLIEKAKEVAQTNLPDWLLSSFNNAPLQGLMEAAQQLNSSKAEKEQAEKFYTKELADLALQIFPDTKVGEKIEDYSFDEGKRVSLAQTDSTQSFFNLKDAHDFGTLQDVVLHRMANTTGNTAWRNVASRLGNQYYITSTDINGERALSANIKRFNSFLHFNRISTSLFDLQPFITQSGTRGVRINKKGVAPNDVIQDTKKTDRVDSIINFLSERFGYKENVESITRANFKAKFPNIYNDRINSAVIGDKIYLIVNSNTNDITAEELLHPFINALTVGNTELFNNLLTQAMKDFPILTQEIYLNYKNQPINIQHQEIVTQALARVFNEEQEHNEPISLKEAIKDFVKWLVEGFKALFDYYNNSVYTNVHLDTLSPRLSLQQLAHLINTTDSRYDTLFGPTFFDVASQSMTEDMYQDIYKSLSDVRLEAGIGNVMAKLPETISQIKRAHDKETNEKVRQELNSLLHDIHEVQTHEAKIKTHFRTIVTVVNLLAKITQKIELIDRTITNPNEAILAYNAMYKVVKSVAPFQDLITELYNVVEPIIGHNPVLKTFYELLDKAIKAPKNAESRITGLLKNPIIEELAGYNAPFFKQAQDRLNNDRKLQENKLNSPHATLEQKARASKKISKIDEDIARLPTKDTFSKIFSGKFNDANSISMILESGIVNGHPLVSTLMSMIEDVYTRANQSLLRSRTLFQQNIEALEKATGIGLRDQGKFYKPITVLIERPKSVTEVDGEPKFVMIKQRALLNFYEGQYITEKEKLDMYVNHVKDKKIKADVALSEETNKVDKDDAKIKQLQIEADRLAKLYDDVVKSRYAFNEKNSEREYLDEVYAMFELQDKVIGINPETNKEETIHSLKNNIYQRIEDAEDDLRKNLDADARTVAKRHIALLRAELRELKNPYIGKEKKQGFAADVVKALTDYDVLHRKYGEYTISKHAEEEFAADMMMLEDELAKGEVSQDEYERRKSLMTRDEIDPDYFDALNIVYADIAAIMEKIMATPSLAKNFNIKDKEAIKDGYDQIRQMVKPYRDADGVIDGELMTQAVPNSVKIIKDLQQTLESIKQSTEKTSGLSISESVEMQSLYIKLRSIAKSDPDYESLQKRYWALQAKRADIRKHAKEPENKILLEDLEEALIKIGTLTEGSTTHYYHEAIDKEKQQLKGTNKDLAERVEMLMRNASDDPEKALNISSSKYIKDKFGKWDRVVYDDLLKTWKHFPQYDTSNPLDTGDADIREKLLNEHVDAELTNSDWWKANHYIQLKWDVKGKGWNEVYRPIYIWEKQTPRNEEYITKDQPSIIYRKYTIKEKDKDEKGNVIPGYINKNYRLIQGTIAAPKQGLYENKEYVRMKTSQDKKDEAYMTFLEFARERYLNAQSFINKSVGDILPSIMKTHGENIVNTTNQVIDKQIFDIFSENVEKTDSDNALLLGGSMFKSDGIPIRFTAKMDESKQSANISAMLLVFELASAQHNEMNKKLPIIETIQNLAGKTAVTQSESAASKLGFLQNIKHFFTKNGTSTVSPKETKQSTLSKTIDNYIDMFVYGRTTKSSTITIAGKVIDVNKVVGNVLGFAAKSIFIGNIFAAVKNSVATRIQVMIQSNVKQGIYSQANFNKAHGQFLKYVVPLMNDYSKVGDKSLMGQVLDYFNVMPESLNGQFTSKTEFTIAKEKMAILAGAKGSSEFEVMVVQFLTFANGKMVDVNGKKVPLAEIDKIFEKDKEGVLKFKDGVTFPKQEEDAFLKIFRKYTREIAGAYRQTEQTQLETGWGGKLLMYLHKYLTPGISNRYAGRRYSAEEGDITQGYYGSVFRNLISIYTDYSWHAMEMWDDLSPMEQAHFIKFSKELAFMLGLFTLTALLGSGDKKKELEQNSWWYNFALAELMAVKTETETFAFAVGSGTDDLIRILRNPVIASQQIANVYKLFALALKTVSPFSERDSLYYKNNQNLHHAGDSKLFAQFLKVLGYTGRFWDGPEMVKQQQQIQTLR